MSMIRCDHCDRVFDTDYDLESFQTLTTANGIDIVICEWCREIAEDYSAALALKEEMAS